MKLWQKVSALNVGVLLAVVIVCGVLLLGHARDTVLAQSIEQARARQNALIAGFTEMAAYYLGDDASPVVKASGVKYCFGRFADKTSVLMKDGEAFYSSVTIDPAEYLPPGALRFSPVITGASETTGTDTLPEALKDTNGTNSPLDATEKIAGIDATKNAKEEPDGTNAPRDVWSASQEVIEKEILDRNVLIVGSKVSLLGDEYGVYTVVDVSEVYNDIAILTWRFAIICAVSILIGMAVIVMLVRGVSRPLIALQNITRRIAVGEYGQRADIRTKDEVGALAADFNAMAEAVQSRITQLEDASERQLLFIGALTHELKTPMASMLLHTDTLLTADLSADETKRSLAHLHEQCRWLERLSQRLLKLITLEQEIHTQPERACALLDDVRDSTAETLRERHTPLVVECSAEWMTIDYDLMKSLLINLVDNASKASAPGQEIWLRAYEGVLEVVDSGKGIAPEEIARVTDAFYMADRSRSKKDGGSGLGLTLAKYIAAAHGAELEIVSEVATGSAVRVVFPASREVQSALTNC